MTEPEARGFQGGFRQSMSWLHTWAGLVLSVVLYFMFVTGSAGYFNTEIDRWMRPELPSSPAAALTPPAMVEAGLARLAQKMPNAKRWSVSLPQGRSSLGLQVSAGDCSSMPRADSLARRMVLATISASVVTFP